MPFVLSEKNQRASQLIPFRVPSCFFVDGGSVVLVILKMTLPQTGRRNGSQGFDALWAVKARSWAPATVGIAKSFASLNIGQLFLTPASFKR